MNAIRLQTFAKIRRDSEKGVKEMLLVPLFMDPKVLKVRAIWATIMMNILIFVRRWNSPSWIGIQSCWIRIEIIPEMVLVLVKDGFGKGWSLKESSTAVRELQPRGETGKWEIIGGKSSTEVEAADGVDDEGMLIKLKVEREKMLLEIRDWRNLETCGLFLYGCFEYNFYAIAWTRNLSKKNEEDKVPQATLHSRSWVELGPAQPKFVKKQKYYFAIKDPKYVKLFYIIYFCL